MNIFTLAGTIMVDSSKADESLSKTDQKAEGLGNKFLNGIGTVGKWGAAVVAAGATAAAALYGVAQSSAETLDNIDKSSQKMGISATAYQEWDQVLQHSGASISTLQTSIKKLTNNMDDANQGSETAAEKFARIGVSITDANGNLRDSESVFSDTITALQGMTNQSERNAIANDLLGGSYTELIPLLNTSADETQKMKDRAHELGIIMDDETVKAGAGFQDMMQDIKESLKAIGTKLGAELFPIAKEIGDWILANLPTIQSICSLVFGFISTAVQTLAGILQGVFTGISDAFSSTGLTFSNVANGIQLVFTGLWTVIQELWNAIGQPIFDLIQTIITTVFDVVSQAFTDSGATFGGVVDEISGFWNNTLLPCLTAIGDFIQNVLAPAFKWVFENIIGPVVQACFTFIGQLWDGTLKPILTAICDFIKSVFTGDIKGAFEALQNIVSSIWDGITNLVRNAVNGIVDIVKSWGTNIYNSAGDAFRGVIDAISGVFSGIWDTMSEIGSNIIEGLIGGITSKVSGAISAVKDAVGGIIDGAKDMLGIASPSKVFKSIGRFTVQGLTVGMENEEDSLLNSTKVITRNLINTAEGNISFSNNNKKDTKHSLDIESLSTLIIDLLEQIRDKDNNTYLDGRKISKKIAPLINKELAAL